jgi:hypothetical protein
MLTLWLWIVRKTVAAISRVGLEGFAKPVGTSGARYYRAVHVPQMGLSVGMIYLPADYSSELQLADEAYHVFFVVEGKANIEIACPVGGGPLAGYLKTEFSASKGTLFLSPPGNMYRLSTAANMPAQLLYNRHSTRAMIHEYGAADVGHRATFTTASMTGPMPPEHVNNHGPDPSVPARGDQGEG